MKMRKKVLFAVSFIIIFIIIYNQVQKSNRTYKYNSDLLMIVDNEVQPYIAKDQNKDNLKTITDILSKLKWVEKSDISKFSKSTRESDYKFWNKSRTINNNIWFDNDRTIIFNVNSGQYAYINDDDSIILEKLLDELTPSKVDLMKQYNSWHVELK